MIANLKVRTYLILLPGICTACVKFGGGLNHAAQKSGEIHSATLQVSGQQRVDRLQMSEEEKLHQDVQRAYLARNSKQMEKMVGQLRASREDSPLLPSAIYLEGLLAFESGDAEMAKIRMTELLRRYPKSDRVPAALYALGYIHQSKSHISSAKNIYRRLLTHYPESPDANRASLQMEIIARGLAGTDKKSE